MAPDPPSYEPYEPGRDVVDEPEPGEPEIPEPDPTGGSSIMLTVDGKRVDLGSAMAGFAGMTPQLLAMAGLSVRSLPSPESVDRLEEPPRQVPLGYRLAAMNMGVVEAFVLFMVAVSPLAVWLLVPGSATLALCIGSAVVLWRRVRRYRRVVPLLRRGEVVSVQVGEVRSTATTMTNMPMRAAEGWDSRIRMYSGSSFRTELQFSVGGREGRYTVKGQPYGGGVVLADPSSPGRAVCISDLPFAARPGPDGRWDGRLPLGTWIAVALTWSVVGLLLGATAYALLG